MTQLETVKTYNPSDYATREEYFAAGYSENWGRPQITLERLNEIVSEADDLFSVMSREDWLQFYGDALPGNEIERTGKGDLLAVVVADWDSEVYYLEVRTVQPRENEIWIAGYANEKSQCVTYAVWGGVEEQILQFIADNSPDEEEEVE